MNTCAAILERLTSSKAVNQTSFININEKVEASVALANIRRIISSNSSTATFNCHSLYCLLPYVFYSVVFRPLPGRIIPYLPVKELAFKQTSNRLGAHDKGL